MKQTYRTLALITALFTITLAMGRPEPAITYTFVNKWPAVGPHGIKRVQASGSFVTDTAGNVLSLNVNVPSPCLYFWRTVDSGTAFPFHSYSQGSMHGATFSAGGIVMDAGGISFPGSWVQTTN